MTTQLDLTQYIKTSDDGSDLQEGHLVFNGEGHVQLFDVNGKALPVVHQYRE